ncbi:MAG: hypothetical protein ACAH83_16005 [Alphaproteobacteria bacterium]
MSGKASKKFNLDAQRQAAMKELKKLDIKYVISAQGDVVVPGHVKLDQRGLTELPDLSCVIVRGGFFCHSNKLTSLKGAPKAVGENFFCFHNDLTTLDYAPKKVGGDFVCHHNELVTLENGPEQVFGDFTCYQNPITSLEGGPRKVGGDYAVHYCHLSTLEGAPKEIGGKLICFSNPMLLHLEHAPNKFALLRSDHGDFSSLDDMPDNVRYSPETLERLATVLQRSVTIRKPLKLAM